MSNNKILIYILISFFSLATPKTTTPVEEFKEYEVKNYVEFFSFKNEYTEIIDYVPDIIIFIENQNYIGDYSDKNSLRISKTKSIEYHLKGINTIVLQNGVNEGKGEYILKFKNYIGAKFFIYNSIHSFPLNDFSKEFYLLEERISNLNLKFHSNILESDTEIDIGPISFITIKNITKEKPEILEIKANKIKLAKGCKYTFEYNIERESDLYFYIKKTNIIKYEKDEEKTIKFFYNTPNYIFINTNEFENEMLYIYLYNIRDRFYLEIEEYNTDNNKIEQIDLDTIQFKNKLSSLSRYPIMINKTEVTTNTKKYLLLKITYIENYYYNYINMIFKIFENYINSISNLIIRKETLFIFSYDKRDHISFVFSDQRNLRIFENKQPKSTIFHRAYFYFFPFIILPSELPLNINMTYYNKDNSLIYTNKFIYKCHLSYLFSHVDDERLLIFNANKKTTIKFKTYFGKPKIFYSDNFDNDTITNINEFRYKNLKKFNFVDGKMTFDSDFIIYIYPYEESYLDILINEEDDLMIYNEEPLKYLIQGKEYILKATNCIINIEDNYDSNLIIYDAEGKILSQLDINNKMVNIDEASGDLLLKSDKNVTINIYYNINEVFELENVNIIEFPIDKIGKIMIIKILSFNSNIFYYAMNYGYNRHISYNTQKKGTNQNYFFIEDPYSKIDNYYAHDNLRYYIILMNKDIKYEITYINQYKKENNMFYYRINPEEDYAIVSENNYPQSYSLNEILFCKNKNISIDIIQENNETLKYIKNNSYIFRGDIKSLYTFNSQSEFLFLQKEFYYYSFYSLRRDFIITYYILQIDNSSISILINNTFFDYYLDTTYSIILIEDKDDNDTLKESLDNECFLFDIIENKTEDINYEIIESTFNETRFAFIETNYSKFISEHILLKIYSCKNNLNICIFSQTKRIYLENRNTIDYKEDELGAKQIEEFKEYDVTDNDFLFVYNYKNYYDTLDDILIYININAYKIYDYYDYYTTYKYLGSFEVFNPLMEKFTFNFGYTDSIPLEKGREVVSYGKYYILFRNIKGATFSIHNSLHMFSLNKIDTFTSETRYNLTNNRFLFFSMNLKEETYFYAFSTGDNILYSVEKKTTQALTIREGFTYLIPKGHYILISDCTLTKNDFAFSYSINRYLIDIKPNIEYSVLAGYKYINLPSKIGVIDLSKYKNNIAYLTYNGNYSKAFSCQGTLTVEDTMTNFYIEEKALSSHLFPFSRYVNCSGSYPYTIFKLFPSKFEVVQEAYYINTSQSFTFKQNDTVAFNVDGGDLILIQSTQENLKDLAHWDEYHKTIFIKNNIEFKIKLKENIETNLTIHIFENKKNISFLAITDYEISRREIYNKKEENIEYFINLSKNRLLINNLNIYGKLKIYVSKDFIDENLIEKILEKKEINEDLFDLMNTDRFFLNVNKIVALKFENIIYSELLISPEMHNFFIGNYNSKFLKANKKYFINSYVKILLEEKSDTSIKILYKNNTECCIINKLNNIFENELYDKDLFLIADHDTVIYVYYPIDKKTSKIFYFNEENKDKKLILFSSDCYGIFKHCVDISFENYYSFESLNLKELSSIIEVEQPSKYILNIDLKIFQYCECPFVFIGNSSGFYEEYPLNYGFHFINESKKLYIYNSLNSQEKSIYYHYMFCDAREEKEIYVSIDGNSYQNLNKKQDILTGENNITFILDANNEEILFNYYRISLNIEEYENIERNNYTFHLDFISKNKTKIDLLPVFKNIILDYYIIIYISYDIIDLDNNPLLNKCYLKKLIDSYINKDLYQTFIKTNETLIIQSKSLQNDTFQEIIIETPDLENAIIFTNIIAIGKIFDIEEIIFYKEKAYKYEKPSNKNNGKYTTKILIGILIGVIVLFLLIISIYLYKRFQAKKMDFKGKEDDKRYSINDMYQSEEELKEKYETTKVDKELEDFKNSSDFIDYTSH